MLKTLSLALLTSALCFHGVVSHAATEYKIVTASARGTYIQIGRDIAALVAAVLWQLNWQMRIGYFVALFPVRSVITKGHPGPSEIRTVGVVMVVLAVAAVWWHFRGLPRGSATVLRAALRQDRFLTLTYLVMALTLVVYAVMAVTGWAAVAALIVPLAVVLGLLIIGKAIGDAIKGR